MKDSAQPDVLKYGTFSSAFGIGCLITVMISLNGQLAQAAGQVFSLLVIHISGGLVVFTVLAVRYMKGIPLLKQGPRLPWLYYIGGGLGVVMVFGNNICFSAIGVSVTMAAGILGQTAGSLLIDATGMLGMRRYRFLKGKVFGLLVILFGVSMMVDTWKLDGLFLVIALLVGGLTIMQMALNARLASSIGLMPGVGVNYTGGILAAFVAVLVTGIPLTASFSTLPDVPLYLVIGGGMTGFCIVTGVNTILPKIPTFYSSLLIFLGQISSAITVDALLLGLFSYQRVIGAVLILLGILSNMIVDRRGALAPVRGV